MLGLGLALSALPGLNPFDGLSFAPGDVVVAIAATVPMAALLLALPKERWRWARELSEFITRALATLFDRTPSGSVALVSILAGVGEELFFRGVIQGGLEGWIGALPALLFASILFGAAHAVSLAYGLLAAFIGLYLGWLYQHTGNLAIPMAVHALYDWVAIRYYLAQR